MYQEALAINYNLQGLIFHKIQPTRSPELEPYNRILVRYSQCILNAAVIFERIKSLIKKELSFR